MVPSAEEGAMRRVLASLSTEDVIAFEEEFYRHLIELNHWKLWGAGYLIAGGMSDDSFHYFRSWIIGKGKDCFEMARKDPDGLGPFLDEDEVENECLEYVALDELESRGVTDDPRDNVEGNPDDEPKGEEDWDDDNLAEKYPRLFALIG